MLLKDIAVKGLLSACFLLFLPVLSHAWEPPATQATSIVVTGAVSGKIDISWTNGDGDRRIVVVKDGSAVSAAPVDGITYTADAVIGGGTELGDAGSGVFVVYDGTGNTATISGVTDDQPLYIQVFEYSTASGSPEYLRVSATDNPINYTNLPTLQVYINDVDGEAVNDGTYKAVEFGPLKFGDGNVIRFAVQNTSLLDFTLSSINVAGSTDFSIVTSPPATISAGAVEVMEIQFSPSATGAFAAEIQLQSATDDRYTFPVHGESYNILYYSRQSGQFDNAANWNSARDGVSGTFPTSTDHIDGKHAYVVQAGHNMTNADGGINVVYLEMETDGGFNPGSTNASVLGQTVVGGTFIDNDGQGVDLFGGKVTVQETGVFQPTLGEIRFEGGIVNDGTMDMANADTYFQTNTQSVVPNKSIRNASNVFFTADTRFERANGGSQWATGNSITIADGVTVTNAGTLAFDSENLTGSGFITQEEDATLAIFANNITIPSFNLTASATGNTVRYNRSSGTQTLIFTDYYHLEFTDQNTGTGVKNFSSGFMSIDGDLRVYCSVNLVGNIALAGDFDHSSTFSSFNAGTGGVEFVDFNDQTIFGSALSLYTMNLNKRGGDVIMETDVSVSNDLLLSGLLDVGANTLQLSSPAAFFSFDTGFDSNNMIRLGSGGVLRMETPFVADYLFPIGTDHTFSPALMDLQSATFSGAVPNYFELSLEGTQSPDVLDPDLALARYWEVTTVNITNVMVNMRYKYDQSDVGTDDADYVPAWYIPNWSLGPLSDVDEVNDTITYFMGGLPSLAYTYTAGEENAFFPAVKEVYPAKGSSIAGATDSIVVVFNTPMDNSTYSGNFDFYGAVSGTLTGTLGTDDDTVTFIPDAPFVPGEKVTVTVDNGIQAISGTFLNGTFSSTFKVQGVSGPETPNNFIGAPEIALTTTYGTSADIQVVDMNGDGFADILLTDVENSAILWYQNDGSGNFTENFVATTTSALNAVVAADLDKNGTMDIVSLEDNAIVGYINDGGGTYTPQTIENTLTGYNKAQVYDSDADGNLDIVFATGNNGTVEIIFGDGGLGFTAPLNLYFASVENVFDIDYGDIDCDGDLDIAVVLLNSVVWLEQDGRTSFLNNFISSTISFGRDVEINDLDGDGDMDILYSDILNGDPSFHWAENDGNQAFVLNQLLGSTENPPSYFYTGDIDGDNDVDIAGAFTNGGVHNWLENDGTNTFNRYQVSTGIGFPSSMQAADMDGDGDIDLVGASGSTLYYMPNASSIPADNDSAIVFSNYTATSMDVTWTASEGEGRLVIASADAPADGVPTQFAAYTANAAFGSGDLIGTNAYVVYNGTGNTFTLSNLSAGTTYYLQIFAYNGTSTSPTYIYTTPTGNPNSTLLGAQMEVYNGTGISGTPITNGQSTITDFGTLVSGNTFDSTFTIYNSGTTDLAITGISMDGGTGFTVLTTPTTVTAGAFETFTVQLGGAVSFYQDSVVITSDDPANPSFKFPVEGTTIDPVFYSQGGTLDFTTSSSWNTSTAGTGVAPTANDFISGLGSFIIQDGDSLMLTTDSVSLFDLTVGVGGLLQLNTDGVMYVVSNTTTDSDIDMNVNARATFGGSLTMGSTADFTSATGTSVEFQNGLDIAGTTFRHQGLTSISTNAQVFNSSGTAIIRLEGDVTIDADLSTTCDLQLGTGTATSVTVNGAMVIDGDTEIGAVDVLGTGSISLLDSITLTTDHGTFQPTLDASGSGVVADFNGTNPNKDVPVSTYHNLYFLNTTQTLNLLGNVTVDNFANINTPELQSNGFSMTFLGDVVTGASTHADGDVSNFIFAGTSLQDITTTSATDTLVNVEISNPAGVFISGNGVWLIDGQLTLNGGNLIIADVLNFSEAATVADGGPGFSASNMIQLSGGNAEVRQYTDNPGNWTLPTGRSGQYLPATLSITAITSDLPGSTYFDIIPENTAEPTAIDATLALQNYWSLSGANFSGLDMGLSLGYNDAEVLGDESLYISALYSVADGLVLGAVSDVDETNNTIDFAFSGLDDTIIARTLTAGEPAAFTEADYSVSSISLSDAALSPGTTDELVYRFSIEEIGGNVDAAVDAVTLDFATGSAFVSTDFNSFALYLSTDSLFDLGDTQLGSTLNPVDETDQLAFATTNFPATIPAGSTMYFLLTADVGSGASNTASFGIAAPTVASTSIFLNSGLANTISLLAGATFTVSADPDIAVYEGEGTTGTEVTDAQATVIAFNSTAVTFETSRQFTIANTGLSDLVIDTLTFTNTEFYIASAFPDTILAGESDTITVTFAPSAEATFQDTLVIASNDPDEAGFRMPVQGTGTATPEPAITVYLGTDATGTVLVDADASPVDFGTSTLGNPVTFTFAIANNGSDVLNLSSISLDNGAHYSIGGSPNLTIVVGGIENFTLTLEAGIIGVFPDVLHIFSDVSGASADFEINVTGEIIGPDIAVYEGTDATGTPITNDQSTEVDLGVALIGNTLSTTIAIENPGTDNLTITDIQIGTASYSITSTIPAIVAPGAVETFDLQLDGSVDGTFKDTVRISSDDAEDPLYSFPVTGRISLVPEPEIAVYEGASTGGTELFASGAAYDLGTVLPGATATADLTIENIGVADLQISPVDYTGGFAEVSSPVGTIVAGASQTFSISFSNSVPGIYTGTLTINNDDADEGAFVVNLSIEVLGPEIVVYDGSTTASPQVSSGVTAISLAPITQGGTASRDFLIENSGIADLDVSSITSSNPQFVITGNAPLTLASGATDNFSISLTQTQIGSYTTTITINNSDADEAAFSFELSVIVEGPEVVLYQGSGTGSTPLINGATTIDLGSVVQGNTASRIFTIENAGNLDLTVTTISASDPAFTVSGTTSTSIAPGATSTFTVDLISTTIGTYGATVTLSSDDFDEPTFSFGVTGQVNGARLVVIDGDGGTGNELSNGQGDPVNLGQTPLNSNIDKVFTINNDGTDTLFIEGIMVNSQRYTVIGAPDFVAPGQTVTFTVRLLADEVGSFAAEVSIISSTGTFTFPVSGEVITTGLPPVTVVNGVTPDGDGIHEYLRIRNIGAYPDNKVMIYNRWGDLVWEIEGYNNEEPDLRFTGMSNKGGLGELPDGTYYYVINPGNDVKNVSGFILLRR